jgi:hypothetical protein
LRPSQPRGKFFVTGLALFGTLILFFTLASYARSLKFPVEHAAALVSRTGSGIWGLYVGETSDTVYLGQVAELCPARPDGRCKPGDKPSRRRGAHDRGRIIAIPKNDIEAMEIGSSLPLDRAVQQAECLVRELRGVHAALTATPDPHHPTANDAFTRDTC